MSDEVFYSATDLGHRYGCTRQNIRQSVERGTYVAPTITTVSGLPFWSEAAVLLFEKNDPLGERWAARVRGRE